MRILSPLFACSLRISLLGLIICKPGLAQEPIDLGELYITPLRFEESASSIPAALTVITAEEIERSNSRSLLDLLDSSAQIQARDYYGNGQKTSVDLRGFGEFAQVNTLVMIDGRRVNQLDLTGTDWTQIPMEQIEKIEIVRGSGSVLYGDNACGGVINIVTRKGRGEPRFSLKTELGSYDSHKEHLLFEGEKNQISFVLGTTSFSSQGYRRNSDSKSLDLNTNLTWTSEEDLSLGLNTAYHQADYGLAGALRQSQLWYLSRKESLFPRDRIGETDWYVDLNLKQEISTLCTFETDLSFRQRSTDNDLLDSQAIDKRVLGTIALRPRFIFDRALESKGHKLILGCDLYLSDSEIDEYSYAGLNFYNTGQKVRSTDIDKNSLGLYISDTVTLNEKTYLNAGYRHERADYTFDAVSLAGPWTADMFWSDTYVDSDLKASEDSAELGIKYLANGETSLFINYTRGFRFPVTDEYFSVWSTPPVNTGLKAQTSEDYQAGIETRLFSDLTLKATFFVLRLENELFYDPATFSNTNYPRTMHRGAELDSSLKISESLSLNGSYTLTEAFFLGGDYNRNQIPLVSRHKAVLSLLWRPSDKLGLDLSGKYVGKRYFINDQAHDYPRLPDYLLINAGISYKTEDWTLFLRINNIFNQRYSEYGAISTIYSEPGYYPSPERNFLTGVSYRF